MINYTSNLSLFIHALSPAKTSISVEQALCLVPSTSGGGFLAIGKGGLNIAGSMLD